MQPAASASPRHATTTVPTNSAEQAPSSTAVKNSLRRDFASPARVGFFSCIDWRVTARDWAATLSPSPRTSVRKKARTSCSASVWAKNPESRAQAVPPAIVASSQGKRSWNARTGEALAISATRKPSDWKKSSVLLRSAWSRTSPVKTFTSTTPTMRRSESITGKARNLCRTKSSHASSSVAVSGIATTRGIMHSATGRSSGSVRRRRVGSTPRNTPSASVT